ncbi:MAG: CAP domain-containing protein [Bacteroidota bacterium]|nr:CAP domain-containing protein [Bacteroidota bacterium]
MDKKVIKTIVIFILVTVLFPFYGFTQDPVSYNTDDRQNFDQVIDIDQFNPSLMQYLILSEINKVRHKQNAEDLSAERILTQAAKEQSEEMADDEVSKIHDPDATPDLVIDYGGTSHATELAIRMSVRKGREYYQYSELAQQTIERWTTSGKYSQKLFNPAFQFAGVGISLGEYGKKVYISVIFGSYFTFNPGAELLDEFEIPITTKSYGLDGYDYRLCRKLDRYKLNKLQNGLSVKEGYIYFSTNDLREFKRIIKRDSKDGLAVDIISRSQYPCDGTNIVDFELPNRGILTKPLYANKLYDYNLYEEPDSKIKLKVELAELPEEIQKDYELNLVLIKDKSFCIALPRDFLTDGGWKPYKDVSMLADTVTINSKIDFIPKAAEDEFIIRIPCTKDKSHFTFEDVKPYVNEINAPPYVISEVDIAVYSSIEASGKRNKIEYHKRAKGIINAIKETQEEEIISDIITGNSWSLFRNDVIGTQYESLAFMGLNDALKYIRQNDMYDELEPIFKKHRFASVRLRAVYDLRGEKEQEYVLFLFNKAIEKEELPLALSIQKFIFKMVFSKKYDKNAIIEQRIPLESKFAGLLMNKVWLQLQMGILDDDIFYKSVKEISKLDPANPYIKFNLLACEVKLKAVGDDYQIYKRQSNIDKLYNSTISKETIDALNLEYQFKIIAALDTLDKAPDKLFESLDKIKNLVNLKVSSWTNSLQLAYLFINHGEYNFASRLLEIFVEDTKVDEELLFSYISLCSISEEKFFSSKFEKALIKASEINKKRYCELFDGKHLSYRVFENPDVKDQYCKVCKGRK